MKKIVTILLAGLMCGAILAGCGNSESPKQVLKGYSDSETYSDGDESSTQQDFSKYTYDKSYDSKFSKDENYTKVTSKNKEDITGYFQDFDTCGQRKAVKIYHKYSVYYYDTESHTLYYIHNNLNES